MNCIKNFPEYWRKKEALLKICAPRSDFFFCLMLSWKVDQTISLPFSKADLFYGEK